MKKIIFTKMQASGNDFVVIYGIKGINAAALARKICSRRYGAGADGLLVLKPSRVADLKMLIFNSDGSQAEMCGNGARCAALWMLKNKKSKKSNHLRLETIAGIVEGQIKDGFIKIRLTEPKKIKSAVSVTINELPLRVHFINTGVPHAVVFVDNLDKIDVDGLGRQIRFNAAFMPQGTNVDFVEIIRHNAIRVRTYERGVEGETLACGTGVVASAAMTLIRNPWIQTDSIKVHTKSNEVLNVYLRKEKDRFKEVWLEGKADIVYKGEYYV